MASSVRKASLAFIFIVIFLDTLGIGLVVPVAPRLIASFLHDDLKEASHYLGLFLSLYATTQFVFAPILGALSDRFGRRPVIFGSLLGAGTNYLLMAFAPSLSWFFLGRFLAGATGASFSAATAYIADITPPERRAQSFGIVGAAFGLGFIVGPALGGVLGNCYIRAPYIAAALLNLANLSYGVFVLPESLKIENRRAFSFDRANALSAFRNLGRTPVLAGLTGTLVCAFLAQQIMQSIWAIHTQSRFGWKPLDIGLSLGVVGVTGALVQGGLVRVIIPKIGEQRALLAGLSISVMSFVLIGAATHGWMLYCIIVLSSLGGIAQPATQAILSREVGASEQGELQGSITSLQSVTAIVGPLLSTRLFALFEPATSVIRIPGAPFFAAALLNACGFTLAWRLFSRKPLASALVPQSLPVAPSGADDPG